MSHGREKQQERRPSWAGTEDDEYVVVVLRTPVAIQAVSLRRRICRVSSFFLSLRVPATRPLRRVSPTKKMQNKLQLLNVSSHN